MNKTSTLSLEITPLPAGLYLLATPIGNLKDISLRALETLHAVDVIACEDTRVSQRLLAHYGIAEKKLLAYHDHSDARDRKRILSLLEEGKSLALVSDAGTPLISDPGYKLAREAIAGGHYVTAIPGACAMVMALTLSGLPSDKALFLGFLTAKPGSYASELRAFAAFEGTLVMYERPSRLKALLTALAEVWQPAGIAIARELTKRFEEVIRGDVEALLSRDLEALKGEVVVVAQVAVRKREQGDVETLLRQLLERHTVRDAVDRAVAETGLPRKPLYARALELSREK